MFLRMPTNKYTPLKLCFVIPGFGEGGAQRQCILLINELSKNPDFEVHLIYFIGGVYFDLLDKTNVCIYKGPAVSMMSFSAIAHVWRCLRRIRPAIVFSWLHSCDVFVGLMKMIRLDTGFRWVMAERDSFYPRQAKYIFREFIGRYADAIACNSAKGRQYWEKLGLDADVLSVHGNILYTPPKINTLQKDIDVLYAGRLEPQKNIEFLSWTLKELRSNSERSICLVGSGALKDRALKILSDSEGSSKIEVHPFAINIFDYYVRARVFVSFSLHEGMPNVLMENVSIGNVVVVSDIPEHVALLGEEYPFYWRVGTSTTEAVKVIERALNCGGEGIYDYANMQLEMMSPRKVADSYCRLFSCLV